MSAVVTAMPGAGTSPPGGQPCAAVPPPSRYRSDSLDFGAYPGAVPSARHRTCLILGEWGLGELADDAAQVVSELVQNAVNATRVAGLDAPVRLTLIGGLRTLLVAVRDAVADPPVPRQAADGLGPWDGDDEADPDQRGKGLIIVAALTARWDWKYTPDGGKTVRALLIGQRHA